MPVIYVILALIVFCSNIIPIFMPPTWTVLTFFYLTFGLALAPTVLIGAGAATLGRICLALLSRYYFTGILSKKGRENYKALGAFLNSNHKVTIPLIVTYAMMPVSSDQVYIAVGLSHMNIQPFASVFFVGRIISYALWIGAAKAAMNSFHDSVGGIFAYRFQHIDAIILEVISIAILWFLSRIPWKEILEKYTNPAVKHASVPHVTEKK